ncbi:hypothetical protein ACFOPX_08455 [Helicobacter baculiformis]|uniref:Mobilization protein n=1 Tax=Helicobacter baculiformis TaxID=427351 RepID=A0ABV7ZJ03_9HELI|nr:hypothetical protein [Helicobacter baculiformis]
MGNIASINFKPTKNIVQTAHNDRSVAPNYLLENGGLGIECSRSAKEASALRDAIVLKASEAYFQHRKQRFRAKSYLWSAVVNVKDTTTMQDLENLAKHFKEKYKFQCYQIAIHRDEGHIDDEGNIRINHHAHLEFVTLDEHTGKSMYRKQYITPKVARDMQTEVANILGMERGKPVRDYFDEEGNLIKGTGRKRIEPRAYGQLIAKANQEHKRIDNTLRDELAKITDQYNIYHKGFSNLARKTLEFMGLRTRNIWEEVTKDKDTFAQKVNAMVDAVVASMDEYIKKLQTSNNTLANTKQWHDIYFAGFSRLVVETLKDIGTDYNEVCAKAGLNPQYNNPDEFNARVEAIISVVCDHIKELTEHLNAISQTITPQDKQLTPAQIKEIVIAEIQKLRDLNHTQKQQYQQTLEAKDKSIDELVQENQALKTSNSALKATLIDLTAFSTTKSKKLTAKELKALAGDVRKQMIAINQNLGEHKLFTQQDYMAVRALIEQGLTFESFSDAIAQIEQEAKERYEKNLENREGKLSLALNKALEAREQELRQEHAEELRDKEQKHTKALEAKDTEHAQKIKTLQEQHTIALKKAQEQTTATIKQYEGYLSPEQVQIKRLEELKSLCILAGVDSKDIPQEVNEARKSLETNIKQFKTDLSALCELAGGGKWNAPKYAKKHLERSIQELKAQADKSRELATENQKLTTRAENAETRANNAEATKTKLETQIQAKEKELTQATNAKADLESAISTAYATLTNTQEQESKLTALDKLKAIIQTLKEQTNALSIPQEQETKTQEQENVVKTMQQEAQEFFENYYKEHKGAILHGFVCREWVFWMDDANGMRLKAHLERATDDELIQNLKRLSFDNLEQANDKFNACLYNSGCSAQSLTCMPRLYSPKTTDFLFCLYDTLAPKVPEIKFEQSAPQAMLVDLERETFSIIAEIAKRNPVKATEMTTRYMDITSYSIDRLAEFNRFLKDELLELRQKGMQGSEGKHK